MLVKAVFNKFQKFPWKIIGTTEVYSSQCSLMSTKQLDSPVVFSYVDSYDCYYLEVYLPNPPVSISLQVLSEAFDNLTKFLQQLDGDKDEFLAEYAVYSAIAINDYARSTPLPIEQLKAIKQDTIDILESFSVSRKLLDKLDKYDVLIPMALFNIAGYLFYQICAVDDKKIVTFTGVNNTGILKDYEASNLGIFPWKTPVNVRSTTSELFLLPNILFGITPIYNEEVESDDVPGIEKYFERFLDPVSRPLEVFAHLGIASKFDKYVDNELVPDSLLEKVSDGKPLSKDEGKNFSDFLDMVSYGLMRGPINWYDCQYKRVHVQKFLESLGLKQLTTSELQENLQKPYSIGEIRIVHRNGKVYVIVPGRHDTLWGFNVSGIDWKQVKRKFLDMVYNYNN